jgi:hypothetical protein
VTRADQAGLKVQDVARPSLKKRVLRYKLDAAIRSALALNAPTSLKEGKPRCTKARRSPAKT